MSRSRFDLARLMTLLAEAHDLDELEPFTPVVLDRVADSLGSDFATYYELESTTRDVLYYVQCSYEAAVITRNVTRIARDDLARHLELWGRNRRGVGAWSDAFPRAVRRRYEVTAEQSDHGLVDAAWMAFGEGGSRSRWLALHQTRDFTAAQRDTFSGSRTHVVSLLRHTAARRRFADLMVAVDTDDEEGASGMLVLGESLGVERTSPAARRIVARWFGRLGSELPEELADWLRSPFPREPLQIERGRERLVVETPTRGAIVLREEHAASESLTAREREVMGRVADGMSTEEIARALWVTPGTVSKHLERIYRKLGVTSRTAALAAVRRTTKPGLVSTESSL